MLPSEMLEAAIPILLERGWTGGTLMDPQTGCVCLEGAVAIALGADLDLLAIGEFDNNIERQLDSLGAAWSNSGGLRPSYWNDDLWKHRDEYPNCLNSVVIPAIEVCILKFRQLGH